MVIRTRSRVVCHFSAPWFNSPSSLSMSYRTQRRKTSETKKNKRGEPPRSEATYSQEFGDGVRLGVADAAVARPHDPPLAVGGGVRHLGGVRLHGRHPPVVTRPRGQSLICEEVPFVQAGDADGGLQDHLRNRF